MASTLFPPSDAALLAWSLNFSTLITATPTAYNLTSAQATAYAAVHASYASALAACDPNTRSKSLVAAKNAARNTLKTQAKLLVNIVNGSASVTNAQRIQLGITPRATPSPIPAPLSSPGLDIVSVSGWTVQIRLHDTETTGKRGRPPGVSGASVFSFVGDAPPADVASFKFEGNTGKTLVDLTFPNTLTPGAKVWITAFWFNGRKQSGPACTPVSAYVQFGGISMAA